MDFSYSVTKDGRVRIAFCGRHVVTVAGARAARLSERLAAADGDDETQQLLARATGNFKRGNEPR